MKVIISPAKKLDFGTASYPMAVSEIQYPREAEKLIKKLRKLKSTDIAKLMDLSPALSDLNYERYQKWQLPMDSSQSKPAIFAFDGEVYSGLNAVNLDLETLEYAQSHLFILSGLYGVLRPMDAILPYRLEMGTQLHYSEKIKNLYQFWDTKLSKHIKNQLDKNEILINLASEEYVKVLQLKKFKHTVITPVFKDSTVTGYKIVMVYAKKARGKMAKFILENKIETIEGIKAFQDAGYGYTPELSTNTELVFTR